MGFRPLIRGFFFYAKNTETYTWTQDSWFPSPHSGILFLYEVYENDTFEYEFGFPSPHSGILFLFQRLQNIKSTPGIGVSVPSFGDSFFIGTKVVTLEKGVTRFRPLIRGFFFYKSNYSAIAQMTDAFPSPHSGILFLLASDNDYIGINAMKFPSPYSGILFLFR